MLSELCKEMKNWFEQSKIIGTFEIKDGILSVKNDSVPVAIANNQYFRIIGSTFNDGVWQYKGEAITDFVDETFDGGVWLMAVPREVIALSADIDAWKTKYMSADSVAMSPFQSESFGGYSYSKKTGGSGNGGGDFSWQNAFASQLDQWRKIL